MCERERERSHTHTQLTHTHTESIVSKEREAGVGGMLIDLCYKIISFVKHQGIQAHHMKIKYQKRTSLSSLIA